MSNTELISRAGSKWGGFALTVLVYLLINIGNLVVAWASAIDPTIRFADLSWQQFAIISGNIVVTIGTTCRSLVNGSYDRATKHQ